MSYLSFHLMYLFKLDVLGHDDPTMIRYLMDHVQKNPIDFPFSSEDTDNDFLVYEIIDSSKHGNINISLDTGFVYTPFNNFFALSFHKLIKLHFNDKSK